MKATAECKNCGERFHPRRESKRMYCSMKCVWAANTWSAARTEMERERWAAAIVAQDTDEDIARFDAELDAEEL